MLSYPISSELLLSCLKAEETNGQLVNYFTRKKKSLANLFVYFWLHTRTTPKSQYAEYLAPVQQHSKHGKAKLPADQHLPSCLQGPADQKSPEEPVQPLHL